MIYHYQSSIKLSPYKLGEVKKFLDRVEKFAKVILPKMGDDVKLFLEMSEVVGRGVVATLYVYGYNNMYSEEEFERLHTANDMEKQVGSIVKSFIGKYDNISASTYWSAKKKIGKRDIEIGPYVEIEFTGDSIYECVKTLSEGKVAKETRDSYGKIGYALEKVYGEGADIVYLANTGKIIDEIGLRIRKDNKKALDLVSDFNFAKVNNIGGINRPEEDELDFLLDDKEEIARFITFLSKVSGVSRIATLTTINESIERITIEAEEVEESLSKEDAKDLEKVLLKAFKVNEDFKRSPKLDNQLRKFCDKYSDSWLLKRKSLKWSDLYKQISNFFGEDFTSFDDDKKDYILTYIGIVLDDLGLDSEDIHEASVKRPLEFIGLIKKYNEEYPDAVEVEDKAYNIFKKRTSIKEFEKALDDVVKWMCNNQKKQNASVFEGRKKDGTDWTPEEVMELVKTNDKVLYGALKYLYDEQTQDEKNSSSTREHNGRGFNAFDAEFLSSLAEQVINKGYLSNKQKELARKKLVRYKTQLTKLANR